MAIVHTQSFVLAVILHLWMRSLLLDLTPSLPCQSTTAVVVVVVVVLLNLAKDPATFWIIFCFLFVFAGG